MQISARSSGRLGHRQTARAETGGGLPDSLLRCELARARLPDGAIECGWPGCGARQVRQSRSHANINISLLRFRQDYRPLIRGASRMGSPYTLELGGKSAGLVYDDADIRRKATGRFW